jgi:Protein of unknown function (DUF1592)/Protein of unknown function (DUF1588)/Protein of unknown function (DUF1595)/Protein of unknown function (DUF1585)/Protein of unknown function (DUF1587)
MLLSKIASRLLFRLSATGCAAAFAVSLSGCTAMISGDGTAPTGAGAQPGNSSGNATGSGGGSSVPGGGTSPSGGTSPGSSETLKPFAPATQSLHRLTGSQFQNSLTALLGQVTPGQIEDDSYIGGFATVGAGVIVTSSTGVEQYQEAIDAALDQVFADTTRRAQLVGCTPKTPLDSACAQTFVKTFGRLAWRKPLTQAQIDRYATLAVSAGTSLSDSYGGLRWAASGLLQSPYFLYRSERGVPVTGATDRNKYTPYELASKLSFFIWNSTPDAALLDSAESGELATADGYQKQAERLLDSAQGHESIVNFAREFMRTDRLLGMAKDAVSYPTFSDTLSAAMGTEVLRLWESTAFDSDSNALELFTTQRSFVNKELGAMYGLDTSTLSADSFSAVTFPASSGRSGILTAAAALSTAANQKEGSPTLRGRFMREKFQCLTVPDPPANVVTTLEDPPAGVVYTKRERMVNHEKVPSCAACHTLMDPLGFALEHFDAIGAYRSTDSGKPIDTTGKIGDQSFDGAQSLGQVLAASPDTAPCMVRNIYSYAAGHEIADTEEVVVKDLATGFGASGNKLRALILSLITSDGFNFVSPESP